MHEKIAGAVYGLIREKRCKPWSDLTHDQKKKFCSMVDSFAASVTSDPEFIVPPPTGEPPGGPPKP